MIKIENIHVDNIVRAVYSARNAMNSWNRSDSDWETDSLGENDLALAKRLSKTGNDHSKFLRMINVTFDVTCHQAWWAEFDTYKVGTVRNSCSKMHKIHVKAFVKEDFSTEGIEECGGRTEEVFFIVMNELERLRRLFNATHEKKYWRAIIEMLPMGYNIKATIQLNYQVLKAMYHGRKNHKLDEWREFCKWCETLPYFKEICVDTLGGAEC